MKKLSTRQILKENLSRNAPASIKDVKILLHNIRSMHNVGAVFRSADAFGISEVLLTGYTPTPPRPEISKTAIGAEEFVEWSYWKNDKELVDSLKDDNYTIIGIEQTENSILLPEVDAQSYGKVCLVMGNEVTGIDDAFLPSIDEFVAIPQYGHKHSLNVSVAAGVVLYAFLEKFWG
ncbi:MAG: RNA methyltransferase [Balneolaceae bacterium]|nr:RNA methyltransferase [Balneolaceae bacterium]